jgi:hypothetical protein
VRNIQGDRCEHRTTPRNELFNPAKSMRTNLEIDESIESKILFYREKKKLLVLSRAEIQMIPKIRASNLDQRYSS